MITERPTSPPASQPKKKKYFKMKYSTNIYPVKDQDYYIPIPLSVYTQGIRALATLANITAIIALEEDSYIDAKQLRALLGLSQKGDK